MSQLEGVVNRELDNLVQVKNARIPVLAGRDLYMPADEVAVSHSRVSTREIPYNNISSTAFTDGNELQFRVPKKSAAQVHDVFLKFGIANASNTAILSPPETWIDSIRWGPNGGAGFSVITAYGETLYVTSKLYNSDEDQKAMTAVKRPIPDSDGKWAESRYSLAAGDTRSYSLHLGKDSFLASLEPNLLTVDDDLIMYLKLRSPVVSGSGTVTLTSLALVLIEEEQSDAELGKVIRLYGQEKAVIGKNAVEVQRAEETQTLTAGSSVNINLQGFTGDCSHLFAIIRSATGTNTGETISKYVPADQATFDIVDATGSPVYSHGTPQKGEFYRMMAGLFWPGNCDGALYAYDMCFGSGTGHLKGVKSGRFHFNGSRYQLRIVLPVSGTQEVQTVTLGAGAMTAGNYRLTFCGDITPQLAYAANAATIQAAVNALPSMLRRGLTVTVNQAFSAGTSITFTFSGVGNSAVPVGDLIDVLPGCAVGTTTGFTTARTTPGVAGWTSGTYTVSVYGFFPIKIGQNKGKFILMKREE